MNKILMSSLAILILNGTQGCLPGKNTPAQQGNTGMVGTTSKAGNTNQTVDENMRVHRDSDGSVPGQPGVSPYEGTQAAPTPTPTEK